MVALTFESVAEILWWHSTETSPAGLFAWYHLFCRIWKIKFRIFLEFLLWLLLGVKWLLILHGILRVAKGIATSTAALCNNNNNMDS